MRKQHQIFFTATTEIRFGAADVEFVLLQGGQYPTPTPEQFRPSTFRERVEWEDGSVTPGVAEPSPFWFIDTGEHKIVVDSGLSAENVAFANQVFKAKGINQYYVFRPEHSVEQFLARHGTSPGEIDIVILSHLHLDHFPNVGIFKNARILVHAKELVVALAPARYEPFHWKEFRPYLLEVIDRIEVLHGDARISPGVEVWHVGGHAPGQLVVVVETSLGRTILASDFFNTYLNLDYAWPPGILSNLEEWERNCRRLKLASDVIVPGHDWQVWERFPDGVIGAPG